MELVDIKAYVDKSNNIKEWFKRWFDKRNSIHLVLNRERERINRSIQYSYLSRHYSEKQWNVPRDNDHHFLNFPSGTFHSVFWRTWSNLKQKFARRYWNMSYQPTLPQYQRQSPAPGRPGWNYLAMTSLIIRSGMLDQQPESHVETRAVLTKRSATYTRSRSTQPASELISSSGQKALYRENTFAFTEVPQCIWASGSIFTIGDQGYFIHRKSQKPALEDIGNDAFTKAVRKFMKGRKTDDYL